MITTEDGKLNGFYYYFYDSGSIRGKFYYVDGKQNGKFITFHENGKTKSVGQSIRYNPYDLEHFFDKEGIFNLSILHIK